MVTVSEQFNQNPSQQLLQAYNSVELANENETTVDAEFQKLAICLWLFVHQFKSKPIMAIIGLITNNDRKSAKMFRAIKIIGFIQMYKLIREAKATNESFTVLDPEDDH